MAHVDKARSLLEWMNRLTCKLQTRTDDIVAKLRRRRRTTTSSVMLVTVACHPHKTKSVTCLFTRGLCPAAGRSKPLKDNCKKRTSHRLPNRLVMITMVSLPVLIVIYNSSNQILTSGHIWVGFVMKQRQAIIERLWSVIVRENRAGPKYRDRPLPSPLHSIKAIR